MKKSKRYLLTINNPKENGLSYEDIKQNCINLEPQYFCMSEEIGLIEKTPHIHVFVYFKNARSFKTIKNVFNSAHIDEVNGSNEEVKNYVFKEGDKWLDNEKSETNNRESHFEYGEFPTKNQGQRSDITKINELVINGYSLEEIIDENPQYAFKIDKIKDLINFHYSNRYKKVYRKLNVVYISGTTGTGKTRYVYDKYGYENVCRITDYKHPFDAYNFEPVIMFEEFREDIPAKDMLKYLESYPLLLPCRYENKVACYKQVYITTNIPITKQYIYLQRNETETFNALLRRINTFMEFDEYGNKFVFECYEDYQKRNFITLEEYEERRKEDEEKH